MKFNLNRKMLSDAINNIIKAVSNKSTIPALEGILISTKENKIELTAYDLELGMKTEIDANILREGKVVLSAKIFSEIVRKAPAEIIEFDINEKNSVHIKSGNSEFNIIGIESNEFPDLPSVPEEDFITINGDLLKGMIRQTIFAIADGGDKPIHQGSLFNIEDGIFDLVSVDGFRLAIRREKIDIKKNANFVVPGKALTEVLKLASENDINIYCGRRHIMFLIDNYTIISSILEGEFIDYKNTIPTNCQYNVKIKTRDLMDSTDRVSLLVSEKIKSPIRCKFFCDNIDLSCTTAIGRSKDLCPCEMTGGEMIEMGFNNRYLLDALKYSECDEVKIHISGSLNPMLITPLNSDDFMFLVLPVRIKAENNENNN